MGDSAIAAGVVESLADGHDMAEQLFCADSQTCGAIRRVATSGCALHCRTPFRLLTLIFSVVNLGSSTGTNYEG